MRYRTEVAKDGTPIELQAPPLPFAFWVHNPDLATVEVRISDDGNDWKQIGTVNVAYDLLKVDDPCLYARIDIAAGVADDVHVFLVGEDGQ